MPENYHTFGEYDVEQLRAAKRLLLKVYEYHYGDSHMKNELKGLEAILNKLDTLITNN